MPRSSTSSSDAAGPTLREWPRPGRALWIAAATLLAFRLLLIPLDEERLYLDGREGSRSYLVAEQRYRVRGPHSPEVVVLGTSRLLDLEVGTLHTFGVDRPTLLLSQPGNTFLDVELLLRRNPDLVARCRLFVVDTVPTMLRVDPYEMDRKLLRFASLAERARMPGLERLRGLADAVLPVFSERHSLAQWIDALGLWTLSAEERLAETEGRWRRTIDRQRNRAALRRLAGGVGYNAYTLEFVAPRGEGGRFHERQLEALDHVLDALPEGCEPLFLFLPFRPSLREAIESDPERSRRWAEFRNYARYLQLEGVSYSWNESAPALGLRSDDYEDGIHFTELGNHKVGRLLAGVILRRLGRAPPPGPQLR